MTSLRGLKLAAALLLVGRLFAAGAVAGTRAAAQPAPAPAGMGGMMGGMNMMGTSGMGNMMHGRDMDHVMSMMSSMTEAMSSPEFKVMMQACQAFMNSPAGRRMMKGMGGSH